MIVSEYEPYFEEMLSQIYLTALHLNLVNPFDTNASFLTLTVYMCLVVTCWEKPDLLAIICGVCL